VLHLLTLATVNFEDEGADIDKSIISFNQSFVTIFLSYLINVFVKNKVFFNVLRLVLRLNNVVLFLANKSRYPFIIYEKEAK